MVRPERIKEILIDCLFRDNEIDSDSKPKNNIEPVIGYGIMGNVGFHPDRIENHRSEIIEMLNELPTEFHKDSGGGWSFLNMVNDKNGIHWGEHQDAEHLMQLGTALGKVEVQLPREIWSALPGGVPYLCITT